MSIEELLATPAPFKGWLEEHGPDAPVGYAAEASRCPLSTFLLTVGGGELVVTQPYIIDPDTNHRGRVYRLRGAGWDDECVPLPEWAGNLARRVDASADKGTPITAEVALRILAEVVACVHGMQEYPPGSAQPPGPRSIVKR